MWAVLIRQLAIFAGSSFLGAYLGSEPVVVDKESVSGWWASQPMIVKVIGWVAVASGVVALYFMLTKKKSGSI